MVPAWVPALAWASARELESALEPALESVSALALALRAEPQRHLD